MFSYLRNLTTFINRQMLANPSDYSALEEYYQARKAFIPTSWDTPQKVTSALPSVLTQNVVSAPHYSSVLVQTSFVYLTWKGPKLGQLLISMLAFM